MALTYSHEHLSRRRKYLPQPPVAHLLSLWATYFDCSRLVGKLDSPILFRREFERLLSVPRRPKVSRTLTWLELQLSAVLQVRLNIRPVQLRQRMATQQLERAD
jgi:hypothetical protein